MTATRRSRCSISLSLRATDANRLNKLIKEAESVVGSRLVNPGGGGGGQDAGETAGNHGQRLSPPPQKLWTSSRAASATDSLDPAAQRNGTGSLSIYRAGLYSSDRFYFSKHVCFEMSNLPANTFSILGKIHQPAETRRMIYRCE